MYDSTPSLVIAYLDPGTGSIIIQAVVAGLVGALALGRMYWSKIKSLVGKGEPKSGDEQ